MTAARRYFGRSASELTLDQAAALAATLPHPRTSNPDRNPGRMRWRQRLILDRLTGPPPADPDIPVPRLDPGGLPVSADSLPVADTVPLPGTLGIDTLGIPGGAGSDTVGVPDTLRPGRGG